MQLFGKVTYNITNINQIPLVDFALSRKSALPPNRLLISL